MYDRILVPTDGSTGTASVALRAADLAEQYGATVYVLHVIDEDARSLVSEVARATSRLVEHGEEAVNRVAALAEAHDVAVETEIREGHPAETIVEYAEEIGADLVVAGTHGRSGVERRVIGSVAERLVRHATVPVLTVHLPETDVTVGDEADAVALARSALIERGYGDVAIDGTDRQPSVWVVEATADDDSMLVYVDPVTQRASPIQRAAD
ncbi:universal stress protein [Halomicrobium urmianum]|uniref:universal stress protein n=1 Tax=Halomicrobium urmianum TaxID=1586233 RepID=UPI001CDA027E|nr:universal stress protein [Halomicrobium urmianum]